MPFKDVREFIARLEREGEAIRIEDEVDWNLEAGAMLRRSAEAGLPAPFFQKVRGYPVGYRIFGGAMAKFKRIAIAMDMDPDTHPRELSEEYLRRKQRVIKPVIVNDGPCKENIHVGGEVDLLRYPVPMIHEGDGGRYIGTWHLTICKDSDWVNWGMYRHMLHNKNTVGILTTHPSKHFSCIYTKAYEPASKPMPVAIAIGVEPVSTLCATSSLPYGVSEVDIAGAIRGEPVELVKCETIDLHVPATAEIVIEGEMSPDKRMDEGPFGEYTGYMAGLRRPRPVVDVKAVTHRNDPILTMSCMGISLDDNCVLSLTKAATMLELLRAQGLPVTSVSNPPETGYMLAVVAVGEHYPFVADDIAHAIWGAKVAKGISHVIIVDDDVDPFDLTQVFHALVTRCHPFKGIVRLERTSGTALLPWASPHEHEYGIGARVYFDCTWPFDWALSDVPRRVSFAEMYPSQVQQAALGLWRKYGY